MTNKPFLIIQLRPEDSTADNELAKICQHGGLQAGETERIRAEINGLPEIELQNYAGIIVGGSPFDVSTPLHEKSDLQIRVEHDFAELIGKVTAADFPFLGCCSGNGLLGSFLGATISRRYGEAVGVVQVQHTEAGKNDPLLADFPDTFAVLTGHKEACDELPEGCQLLLTNATCPVQMFRFGDNVYATQFHPEGDAEGFALRINVYKNHGYFPAKEAAQLIANVSAVQTPFAQKILSRFVSRYRSA
jgi:GMP synthase (glutamine-hydrolysing)